MGEILVKHIQRNYQAIPRLEVGKRQGKCRFCKSIATTYDNTAHAIPEFLGNKSIFTLDECDECNSYFGRKIERDLSEFVPPSWFTKLKGKKGYRKTSVNGGFTLSGEDRFLNISCPKETSLPISKLMTNGRSFSPLNVYKAWVKILVAILPEQHLPDFDHVTNWLLSMDGFDKINHKPYLVIGHQLADFRLTDTMEVEVIRQIIGKYPVYQLFARFNNFQVKLPFSPKAKIMFGSGVVLPAENNLEKIHFEELDLSEYASKINYRLTLTI